MVFRWIVVANASRGPMACSDDPQLPQDKSDVVDKETATNASSSRSLSRRVKKSKKDKMEAETTIQEADAKLDETDFTMLKGESANTDNETEVREALETETKYDHKLVDFANYEHLEAKLEYEHETVLRMQSRIQALERQITKQKSHRAKTDLKMMTLQGLLRLYVCRYNPEAADFLLTETFCDSEQSETPESKDTTTNESGSSAAKKRRTRVKVEARAKASGSSEQPTNRSQMVFATISATMGDATSEKGADTYTCECTQRPSLASWFPRMGHAFLYTFVFAIGGPLKGAARHYPMAGRYRRPITCLCRERCRIRFSCKRLAARGSSETDGNFDNLYEKVWNFRAIFRRQQRQRQRKQKCNQP